MEHVKTEVFVPSKGYPRACYTVNNTTDKPLQYKILSIDKWQESYSESMFICQAKTICLSDAYYLPANISPVKEEEDKNKNA